MLSAKTWRKPGMLKCPEVPWSYGSSYSLLTCRPPTSLIHSDGTSAVLEHYYAGAGMQLI